MDRTNKFLDIKNIHLSFDNKDLEIIILRNLNLKVKEGDFVAITGASGSGKTSLFRAICGLETPNEGEIILDNSIIFNKEVSIPTEKRNIGLVIQEKVLFPHMNTRQNIEFGISKSKNRSELSSDIMKKLKIQKLSEKYPHQLSGGESQRVALARSIVMKPKLLLLDEPFSGLDTELKTKIYPAIKTILEENNITCLMVTHDLEEVKALADKLLKLESGKLLAI
jgi:ABC-type Fe3+/spermidine/putrescine transport system ATPase subunit|tara:strand:- start:3257 stop:3928 length:672 start_codon:yes stop_codon:yes gene_type:complete